jgi:ABC-type dipeptide/oligopeptide/nickel transport system ATPase component
METMKIIMLAGKSGTGKSQTIRMVYDRLSNNIRPTYYQVINNENPPDIECYPLYHHDKKIALCSAGDCWDYIKNAITKFHCIGADVLIIAFSEDELKKEADKNKAIETDMGLFNPDILIDIQPHCVIKKRVTGEQNTLPTDVENNERDCQAIIDRI